MSTLGKRERGVEADSLSGRVFRSGSATGEAAIGDQLRDSNSLSGEEDRTTLGAGDGEDYMSQLPDDALHTILSFLPLRDAARTGLLSHRWRRLWSTSTLHLDLDDSSLELIPLHHLRLHVIARALSSHTGPVQSCRISGLSSPWCPCRTFEVFLQTLAQRGVRELTLTFFKLPAPVLSCGSLHILNLRGCKLPQPFEQDVRLPHLRVLHLCLVSLNDRSLRDLLSSCPLLETLVVLNCKGLKRIVVRSPSLLSLTLIARSQPNPEELIVEDCPNLEQLMLEERLTVSTCVRVTHAPNLGQLGFINANIKKLELGKTCIGRDVLSRLSTLLHGLKKMAIRMNLSDDYQNKMASDLLKCSPCLETLDILFVNTDTSHDERLGYWEQQDSFDCLKFHLKSVKLKGFLGHKADVGFAKFLITRARVLKLLAIHYYYTRSEKWIETSRAVLHENRASVDAEVVIRKDQHCKYVFSSWEQLF